jgi:F-type H+-transporting ATPase subunit b
MPAAQRAAIQNALNETFSAEIRVRFETAPELVGGIELAANGQKVAWSIADYLASLESGLSQLLKEQDKSEPKAGPRRQADAPAETEVESKPKPETEPKTGLKSEAGIETKAEEHEPVPMAQ